MSVKPCNCMNEFHDAGMWVVIMQILPRTRGSGLLVRVLMRVYVLIETD